MNGNDKDINKIDMINGPIWNKLIFFALPLAASSILQQLFNAVDTAIAGTFAKGDALASVGANASVISVFVNLFTGLSIGANVVIATLIGQKKTKEIPHVVHTAIALALICGFSLMVLGQFIATPILNLVNTPSEIMEHASLYLRIYFVGMPAILLYNFAAAILRSIGDTKRPMFALILSGFINVGLNLLLVIVFKIGVAGVAIATVISNIISASIVVYALIKEDKEIKLQIRNIKINPLYLKKILIVGLPAGIQGMVFSLSNVFIQTGINYFKQDGISGSSIALNFECFSYYISNAFSQAAVTMVSQNYGAGNLKRCRRICRIALVEGFVFTEIASAIFVLFRIPLISLFSTEKAVITFACWRMLYVMVLEGMTGFYEITGGTLRGMGHSTLPAALTIFGTVGFRILWLYVVFEKTHSFRILMLVYPASWVFNTIMMVTAYFIIMNKEKMAAIVS